MVDIDSYGRYKIQIVQEKNKETHKININGVNIFFPHKPYTTQIKYMESVVRSLQTGKNCALESPTGTGKTLCLLCACLGYTMENSISTIYYSTRTHSQISNVIKELRKTIYKTKIAIISSREHSCINETLSEFHGGELNNQCYSKMIQYDPLEDEEVPDLCPHYQIVEEHFNDDYGYMDIEDICKIATFCPYFYEKNLIKKAKLVFLPYKYIVSSEIRKMMDISLDDSIIIFDEGHNISNCFEEEESIYISENDIEIILSKLNKIKNDIIKKVFKEHARKQKFYKKDYFEYDENYLKNLINIIHHIKTGLNDTEIITNRTQNGSIGNKLTFQELFDFFFNRDKLNSGMIEYDYGLSTQNISKGLILLKFLQRLSVNKDDNEDEKTLKHKIDHVGTDPENDYYVDSESDGEQVNFSKEVKKKFPRIPYAIIATFIKLFNFVLKSANHFISKNKEKIKLYTDSFVIYLSEEKNSTDKIKRTLKIFCMNPEFCYRKILKKKPHSIILTSGTLSPITGIEKELNSKFPIQLENSHVIQSNQLLFLNVSSSNFNCQDMTYNFDFNHRNNSKMIIELGKSIVQIAQVTPGGILLFFTSYSYMEYCRSLWNSNHIITKLSKIKKINIETKEKSKNIKNNKEETDKNTIYFSVFRGSSSEGINFSDDEARLVIIVGLPFSNLSDDKVMLKREYLNKTKRGGYNGNTWYLYDCMRAVNQSLGRVIRHIKDYGVLMVIDERYERQNIKSYFSAWLRNYRKMRVLDFDLIEEIRAFFEGMKNENLNEKKKNNELNKIDSIFDVTSLYSVGKNNLHKKNKRDNNKTFLDLFLSQHENNPNPKKANKIESMFNI